MKRKYGNAAGSTTAKTSRGVKSADRELTVVLLETLTPSLNRVNKWHWSKRARLKRHFRAMLEDSLSPSNVTEGGLTVIISLEEQSSCETQSQKHWGKKATGREMDSSSGTCNARQRKKTGKQ